MTYILGFDGRAQPGVDGATPAAFLPIDDDARAAALAAMESGFARVPLPSGYTYQQQMRGEARPAPPYRYDADARFAYFARTGELFSPRTAGAFELANAASGPARTAVRLMLSTLARAFVGAKVFVDLGSTNRWLPATVAGDGSVVAGPGGAPVPVATVAAEVLESSRSGLARSGSLRALYTAADGGLYLGSTEPVASTRPPVTAAEIALLPRDGRLVAFQSGTSWSVVEWR